MWLPGLGDESISHQLGDVAIPEEIEGRSFNAHIEHVLPPEKIFVVRSRECRTVADVWEPLWAGLEWVTPALSPFGGRRSVDSRRIAVWLQNDRFEKTVHHERASHKGIHFVIRKPNGHEACHRTVEPSPVRMSRAFPMLLLPEHFEERHVCLDIGNSPWKACVLHKQRAESGGLQFLQAWS